MKTVTNTGVNTGVNIAPLLQAVIYGDSAYPSGRYTLSHGLEGLVQQGVIQGAEQVGQALIDHLRFTAAPGDGVATAMAVMLESGAATSLATLIALDHELSATKITEPLRKASTRVGKQTLSIHNQVSQDSPTAGLLASYTQAIHERKTPVTRPSLWG